MKKKYKIILIISLLCNLTVIYVAIKAWEYRTHINEYLDKYTNVVNEFSRRDVFQESNVDLKTETTVDNRIVFFGSQIISRWNLKEYFPEYEAVNRGVEHQRLSGFLLRFRPDVIDLHPKAVIIEVSSYNFRKQSSVQEIYDYVISIMELARYNNIEPIPGTIIPPLKDSIIADEYKILDSLKQFNNRLKSYCSENNFTYIDFNSILSNVDGCLREDYASGAIDINENGYRIVSEKIRNLLIR